MTVCVLAGFNDLLEALRIVRTMTRDMPDSPYVILERHIAVAHASDRKYAKENPAFLLMNARTIGLRVFVMCDRLQDLPPIYRTSASHVVAASSKCESLVPCSGDLIWMNFDTMRFELVR